MSAHALGNGTHRACHHLRVDAHAREPRQERVELPITNQRLTTDDRELHRAMAGDEIEHAIDERLPLESDNCRRTTPPPRCSSP